MEYKVFGPAEGDKQNIGDFIKDMDYLFTPTLASRLNIDDYIDKIYTNATKFTYMEGDRIVAMGITYINKKPLESFGTYLAVSPEYSDTGIGLDLVVKTIRYAEEFGSASFRVMIRASNKILLKFYKKMGFEVTREEQYPNSDVLEYEMVKVFK